eukprot:2580994-Amphidinium_carterae.1
MGIDWFASLEVDECIYVPKQQENSARRCELCQAKPMHNTWAPMCAMIGKVDNGLRAMCRN